MLVTRTVYPTVPPGSPIDVGAAVTPTVAVGNTSVIVTVVSGPRGSRLYVDGKVAAAEVHDAIGHAFDEATMRANYDYYEPRCSHNSSLSHAVYGFVAAHIGEAEVAHRHFVRTATIDLLNTNHPMVGGTFIGGIHTAACGGTYQLAVQGLGGLGFSSGRLTIDPALPPDWRSTLFLGELTQSLP